MESEWDMSDLLQIDPVVPPKLVKIENKPKCKKVRKAKEAEETICIIIIRK